ncbi:putative GDP-fucose protein O-fucosyltransferase [Rosa chinensis]|uniref:O-fucosyltransferase family protein n=1 Tax=Rosa chinensis TaxID=74649 RepID=A0A2P6Q2E4_ROSCH|nr:putative GDP-fucose protein O-fucosyltransferase [Rosa chinensis]
MNGYLMVTANGGMNQQPVAVSDGLHCNIVVIAQLLNATLVVPKYLYSSIYMEGCKEDHFINYLSPDIRIVKELPKELQSLNLEAIGSLVTDADIPKEAKPSFYLKNITPILLKNGVVHFLGFGNRLSFDPIPFQLQMWSKRSWKLFEKSISLHWCFSRRLQLKYAVLYDLYHLVGYLLLHYSGPLSPEEAMLMLAALGFKCKTNICGRFTDIWRECENHIYMLTTYAHQLDINHKRTKTYLQQSQTWIPSSAAANLITRI